MAKEVTFSLQIPKEFKTSPPQKKMEISYKGDVT